MIVQNKVPEEQRIQLQTNNTDTEETWLKNGFTYQGGHGEQLDWLWNDREQVVVIVLGEWGH